VIYNNHVLAKALNEINEALAKIIA